ncbi:unnamed protein product, partial [Rotaria sp. Silwood2]
GHRLEQIIINYLPQLKVLQFKIDLNLGRSIDDQTNKEKVDQYVATYHDLSICVYSLPYVFDDFLPFLNNLNYHTKSIYPSEMCFSYDFVHKIEHEQSLFNEDPLSNIKLNNIEVLGLKFPIDHRFFSLIPIVENLFSLNVVIPTENYHLQMQALLDRAPHLFSLGFESWNTSAIPPYQYNSSSVRRLDLEGRDRSSYGHCFDSKECVALIRSLLDKQCRILVIEVEEPVCILALVHYMINL